MEIKNILLNDKWVKKETKNEMENFLELSVVKNISQQSFGTH